MERFAGSENQAVESPATPLTNAAAFAITKADVGTYAVRTGVAAELERERNMLLAASKLALKHIRTAKVGIGAAQEYALEQAIRLAELPK